MNGAQGAGETERVSQSTVEVRELSVLLSQVPKGEALEAHSDQFISSRDRRTK